MKDIEVYSEYNPLTMKYSVNVTIPAHATMNHSSTYYDVSVAPKPYDDISTYHPPQSMTFHFYPDMYANEHKFITSISDFISKSPKWKLDSYYTQEGICFSLIKAFETQGVKGTNKPKLASGGVVISDGMGVSKFKLITDVQQNTEQKKLLKSIPTLLEYKAICPRATDRNAKFLGCSPCENELWTLIQHLNDSHKWSREAIADWLETLDVDLTFTVEQDAAQ